MGGYCWPPPESTFSGSATLLETSGKTRLSRMYGLGRLILYAFSLILFVSIVLFDFVLEGRTITKPSGFYFNFFLLNV